MWGDGSIATMPGPRWGRRPGDLAIPGRRGLARVIDRRGVGRRADGDGVRPAWGQSDALGQDPGLAVGPAPEGVGLVVAQDFLGPPVRIHVGRVDRRHARVAADVEQA